MEKVISQNWDLDSLYPGGSHSKKLKELMDKISENLLLLSDELQKFNSEAGKKDLEHLLSILKETQFVMSGWLEADDFLICTYAENVKDTTATNLMAENAVIKSKLASFQAQLDQTLVNLTEQDWEELSGRKEVQGFLFYLEERRQIIKNRLPLEQEKIISALSVNGFEGWEQHHDLMLAQLKIPIEIEGEEKEVSFGEAYNQAVYNPERFLRKKAANAIEQVCEENADAFASVLNRIAGFRLDVYQQRNWDNLLTGSLEQNRITEKSLTEMLFEIKKSKEVIKEYVQRKSKVDQLEKTTWYDMESPSFSMEEKVPYQKAADIIIGQFYRFSEKLGNFAENAFRNGWIETENRPDTAEGGFCASMPLAKESRIYFTYRENYQDVVTIAHELGHAYHNYILHEEPAFAQVKGTSVAETASTFMENLVLDAAINHAESEKEKLALLEMKISNGLQYIAAIPNMFQFELKFYDRRKKGLLTPEEIKTLIADTQNEVYDGLIEELNAYQWMYISHFYDTEQAFYNIPYTIGYLFSNGIYELSKKQREGFAEQYDELLRNSGRMTVEQLAEKYLGQDLRKKDFWEASLKPVREAVEEYLRLTEKMV